MGDEAYADLRAALEAHGQEHLLQFWDDLDAAARDRLAADVRSLDLELLDRLIETLVRGAEAPVDVEGLRPVEPVIAPSAEAIAAGEEALRAGRVAVVIVAGGQGTRLGFDGPKGCFAIGPVTDRSLFQIHFEKVAALGARYGRVPPVYVMTSADNHAASERFLTDHEWFGLEHVRLFQQGTMPAVDRQTGAILLAERDRVALSPDGHGGTLRALRRAGCLDEMRAAGIDTVFYLQVDNPMIAIGDPGFVGAHLLAGAEVSSKVVRKLDPAEKVGVVAERDGRSVVVEYSDMPDRLAAQRRPDGGLAFAAGSIALHVFALEFIARVAGGAELPYHRALKPVPYVNERGDPMVPVAANAVKFEQFIFDTLPLAATTLVLETDRAAEFEPLKNASGDASPETVRQRLSDAAGALLEAAGARVARRRDGSVAVPIEISPIVAADPAELKRRLGPGAVVDGPYTLL
jgi:UDP-N-acetylglucosamine/UDP-N-acetylgalactosamine diphosphorylase